MTVYQVIAGRALKYAGIKTSSTGNFWQCSKILAQSVSPWYPLNIKDWWYCCSTPIVLHAEHCCPGQTQRTTPQHVHQLCSAMLHKHRIITQCANQQTNQPAVATLAGALLNCTIWLPLAVTPWNAPSNQAKRCRVQSETVVKA